jgi:histidinol-phosphate/aromatic aminotransferase/cobyric acid decarboxylase-like protein
MHYMPDTEDEDSAAETFWPEGYKQVIRDDFRQLIGAQFKDGKKLRHIYQQRYSEKFTDINQFVGRIADMVVIGAENGADEAFDDIMSAFFTESPLPEVRRYARYSWPQLLPERVKKRLQQVIVDEYSRDNVYTYAHKAGYQDSHRNFDEFINQVAELVTTGAANGADDVLEALYRSFLEPLYPLPPARRNPRRLRMWAGHSDHS